MQELELRRFRLPWESFVDVREYLYRFEVADEGFVQFVLIRGVLMRDCFYIVVSLELV